MTRPREVTRKRSPRRTFAMYSGSFCRSSVTLTCFMRASYVQMKCTDGKAAHQVSCSEERARGVYTRWVAVFLGVHLLFAAYLGHAGNGWMFSAKGGGYEYP